MSTRSTAKRWVGASLGVGLLLASGLAMGQAKKECQPAGAPAKIVGEITKVDTSQSRVVLKASDGTSHEFQASAEMLQTLKPGDKIEIRLRELPKC
jgi:hypothetical protein